MNIPTTTGKFWMRFHLGVFFLMLVLLPPTLLWWKGSVVYIVWLSWAALAYAAVSSWQAARVEIKQEAMEERELNAIEEGCGDDR